jgi:transcriptional regulator with XRE-family HTH domain
MANTKKIKKSSLSERLSSLMHTKGMSIQGLSRETGIGFGVVQKILADPSSNPTYMTLKTLAKTFNVSIGFLLNEERASEFQVKKVRLIGWENIMKHISKPDCQLLNLDSFIACNLDLCDQAFALKLIGGGLMPFFKENSILVFDPHKEPYDRSFVLVKMKEHDKPILKQLVIDGTAQYIKSISSELTPEKAQPLRAKDNILATLVQSLSNF